MHLLELHRKQSFWWRRDPQFTWQDNSRNQVATTWQLVKRQEGQKRGWFLVRRNNAPLPCNDIMAGFNWPFVKRHAELCATIKLSPIYTCQHSSDRGAHFCQSIGRGVIYGHQLKSFHLSSGMPSFSGLSKKKSLLLQLDKYFHTTSQISAEHCCSLSLCYLGAEII